MEVKIHTAKNFDKVLFIGDKYDGYNHIGSISDLKKCDNVIVGSRIEGPKSPYEVIINDDVYHVMPTTKITKYGTIKCLLVE